MPRFLAALALSTLLWANPAAAAIMQIHDTGDFDGSPYEFWTATVRYDSERGVITTGLPFEGQMFSWDAASGAPSPVLLVAGVLTARHDPDECLCIPPAHDFRFNFTDATQFRIVRSAIEDYFYAAGPGWFMDLGSHSLPDDPPGSDFSFDTPRTRFFQPGEVGGWDVGAGSNFAFMSSMVVTRLAVPEPATWALLILGFGLVGAAMRRRARLGSEVR